jgi:hypothetical protein
MTSSSKAAAAAAAVAAAAAGHTMRDHVRADKLRNTSTADADVRFFETLYLYNCSHRGVNWFRITKK